MFFKKYEVVLYVTYCTRHRRRIANEDLLLSAYSDDVRNYGTHSTTTSSTTTNTIIVVVVVVVPASGENEVVHISCSWDYY